MADRPVDQLTKRPLVGVIVDTANTYGRDILRGIARYANMQRRWLLFKDLQRILDSRTEWPKFDGAIVAGVPMPLFTHGVSRSRHAVYCSGSGDASICPVVSIDDEMAGAQAAEHFLDCRLQRFAYYGVFDHHYPTAIKRLAGFRRALEARGFSCVECPVSQPNTRDWVSHAHRPALIEWLRSLPKPIGILAFDDTVAHELAEACIEADIGVPDRVAIIGINNDDLLCESAWPPLSSVDAGYTRVGYAAAEILDRMFAGEVLEPEKRLVLLPPLGVVQRQSTDVLAIEDKNLADAVRFIRERACDPCSVHDVLRSVPVGRRWLERQFVSQIGRTPHEEIARVRIETSQRLLRQSSLQMSDVAARCGFAELKSFYLAFRRITGTTPAAYRRDALLGTSRPLGS